MKVALYREPGPASEVLSVTELPDPMPAHGEVRVRVAYSSVNPTDWKRRATESPPGGFQIPHHDASGFIDLVGEGVDPARVGERVWTYHAAWGRQFGTAAELLCLPSAQAVSLPESVSLQEGATIGIPFLTAAHAVFADGNVEGKTLLVSGGAGAVGNAAVRLATNAGATVIATISNEVKAAHAAEAGAHFVLDYTTAGFADALATVAPAGVDRVIEVSITRNMTVDATVLHPGGTVVAYASEATDPMLPVRGLMMKNAHLQFFIVYLLAPAAVSRAVSRVIEALDAGVVRPVAVHEFDLSEIAEAHDRVQHGLVGKAVLRVAP